MNWKADGAAVIPCLNEQAAIGAVVTTVRRFFPAVFVVDDGSSDETSQVARVAGAEVLRHDSPRGKGTALDTGWQRAKDQGFAWALTLDGDGQHSPADIPAFLSCAERTGSELISGNRMNDPANMPWLRRRVNRWMSARLSKYTGRNLPDTQCGFRLMNLKAWAAVALSSTHFEIESEVLLAFAKSGFRIEFVPVQVIYEAEQSKIDPLRDTVRWFRWWRRARREPLAGTKNRSLSQSSRPSSPGTSS
jgi:glycosyltransferase involved in cell wall biosynthesis